MRVLITCVWIMLLTGEAVAQVMCMTSGAMVFCDGPRGPSEVLQMEIAPRQGLTVDPYGKVQPYLLLPPLAPQPRTRAPEVRQRPQEDPPRGLGDTFLFMPRD
jgi:hypothetical protein